MSSSRLDHHHRSMNSFDDEKLEDLIDCTPGCSVLKNKRTVNIYDICVIEFSFSSLTSHDSSMIERSVFQLADFRAINEK